MESKPVSPAAAAVAPVAVDPSEVTEVSEAPGASRFFSRFNSVLFYGLVLFGVLFPVVGAIVGVMRN